MNGGKSTMDSKRVGKILKDQQCASCGKSFDVKLDVKGKILTDCFYGGKIRMGIGMWAAYEWLENGKFKRITPWYKYVWFTLKDWWKLLRHDYIDVQYWECPSCYEEVKQKFEE